ncbi:hypothetical protein DKZ56_01325 [Ureibacillus thermophilus]|uniref:histidine kinase n=2 Tax=Ureibacillus thermophilus TaxID=367743 RepID=A0A4P6UN95_9BACL|nr:hypothetical protein DKZ56_01325 [Ureibacillus thermophilus]
MLMNHKLKTLLSLFLITWVIFSMFLLFHFGAQFIGKSYFDSDGFKGNLERFKEDIGFFVLEPFDAEEAKKQITVSQEEIEFHRNYYGSLTEQVENIKYQYQDRIEQAANDPELQKMLIAERDQKIEDIKKNFSDNEHVAKKVRKQKEELVDKYAASKKEEEKIFFDEFKYFAYELRNVETGEIFRSGDVDAEAVFTENFGSKDGYLVVNSSRTIHLDYYNDTLMSHEIPVTGKLSRFEGKITIPKSMMNKAYFKKDYRAFMLSKISLYSIWATALLAIVALLTFAKPSLNHFLSNSRLKETFLKLPVDVRFAVTLFSALIAYKFILDIGYLIVYNTYYSQNEYWIRYIFDLAYHFAFFFIFASISILGAIWLWELLKHTETLKEEWKNAFLYRLSDGLRDLFLNRSIGFQALFILTVVFCAGFGLAVIFVYPSLAVSVYAPLFIFIALPAIIIFLSNAGYLNRILKQTKEMAEGRLTTEVKVKGKSPLAKHAQNLNELQEGIRKSLTEQAKSERLKTELITNVSHDLRTPLTSIITYTDLLKNPEITEEERKRYIEILENKSQRLKTLIEDLFEVSKMSSGNVELKKERINLTQLLQQAIGEHKEDFEKANLELRVALPNHPIYAYVDGQKWWRVIDNLLINALKYSLSGTRVYVTLKKVGPTAEFSVKNIANYELGDNVEELTERFKRADESRHTEGSGLGLAIAQSIAELHQGKLEVSVDGDLFKVVVTVSAE